jgi:hypothetical protein
MKKVLLVLVLMMSIMIVNAQATQTSATKTKTTTTIKVADLQKAITDNIVKDFPGFIIKEATSVTKNNIMTYHVVIVKDATTQTLIYDKDGKFVKIHTPKDGTQPSSKKK